MSIPNPPVRVGPLRGLQRVASTDGFVLVLAVDHVTEYCDAMSGSTPPSFEDVVKSKIELATVAAEDTSGLLIDALHGAGYTTLSGAVRTGGLVVSMEDGDYSMKTGGRTYLREGWDPMAARRAGVDAVKILWWYRPDASVEQEERQRNLLSSLADRCHGVGMPLIAEPIWHPLPGEDTTSMKWQTRRARGIVDSAVLAESLGADMLKVEVPGDVTAKGGDESVAAHFAELNESVSLPWVILSAGVSFDVFSVQLGIASRMGAAGYIAGRAVWREAVGATGDEWLKATDVVRARLRELNQIVRTHGTPLTSTTDVQAALEALPSGWYQPAGA